MAAYNNITLKAYGKINLMLDIFGRQKDGYHFINTVMQSVSCYDLINVALKPGAGIEIICEKDGFPTDETNLIWKACNAFKEHTGIDFGGKLYIKVEKNLPSMAGMGGGSADCAAMLRALDIMYNTFLDDEELCKIGVTLGADVPFCLMGGTRLCEGVGDKMHKLPSPECCFVIVKPEVGISTAEAYQKYDSITNPPKCNQDAFFKALAKGNIYSVCLNMMNVLELAAEDKEEIKTAKDKLMKCGAINSLMTGSGSAVFGVFKDEFGAKDALKDLSEYDYKVICKPVKSGVEVIDKF